jgi:hypothetical protein
MPVRLSILVKKLPSISTEEFNKYWDEKHPSVFLSVPIVKKNLTKYQQFHVDPAVAEPLRQAGMPVAAYDGATEFWAESYEALMAVFQDEEYNQVVIPDEQKFLGRAAASVMIGYESVKLEDGTPKA